MLVTVGEARVLGNPGEPRLRFVEGPKDDVNWRGRRLLTVDDAPAFELSNWCGTCQFLFQRLEGATTTFSPDDPDGTAELDDQLIARFAALLPEGLYQPLLLQVRPRLVRPSGPGDYFAEEQISTWGLESFWGLPAYPRTPYYRTFETAVDADAHLYEFVVPMVPPSWNEPDRVAAHTAELSGGAIPTAVAVAILDVCAPAVADGPDYYSHWALTHFLLDGHHRMQAAAGTGRPLRLLSLLAVDAGLAEPEQIAMLPSVRAAAPRARG
ncbi:hypothetical protein GCM10010112_24760 [Actinoplanes lobatus]|uniref:Uncharacterized protein n=1 Tax=Actinoplanes lobatus TaxID=113568 RepID=A0A7W7MIK2_9ACTN|nr:hypothetical protein [Actinoplanes lobatus]MBB4751518.1 hypothetical protein [Actinoplanes lobatus]GGN64481.1 hypothetical protein GCM10010112_24760 [Actinoplanes lobatus]GIE41127.1 hypothetical protein Alo02nite_40250 [Actinoplanes lobatus]